MKVHLRTQPIDAWEQGRRQPLVNGNLCPASDHRQFRGVRAEHPAEVVKQLSAGEADEASVSDRGLIGQQPSVSNWRMTRGGDARETKTATTPCLETCCVGCTECCSRRPARNWWRRWNSRYWPGRKAGATAWWSGVPVDRAAARSGPADMFISTTVAVGFQRHWSDFISTSPSYGLRLLPQQNRPIAKVEIIESVNVRL